MESGRAVMLVPMPLEPPSARNEQRKCPSSLFSRNLIANERRLVCVTSGNSYMGAHLVKRLLTRGYLVRVTIQNHVDFDDMKEMIGVEAMNQLESVLEVKMGDFYGLCNAFRDCHAIFHTSSFIDPHGVSGYTERMAFLEVEGARNVIEACGRTAYVKRCIFTSSVLALIWRGNDTDRVVDERCWSHEDFCRENKLWLALGKTVAEKIAWRKSMELKVRLVTVCPGLLMAPSFPNAHPETSLPYLKGGKIMLQQGVLATEDVSKMAEAHIHVYEAMDYGACGRYLCFERIVLRLDEVIELENGLKMHGLLSEGINVCSLQESEEKSANLSNSKFTRLKLQASQRLSCKQC